MTGVIIVNASGFSGQAYQAERLKKELESLGASIKISSDLFSLCGEKNGKAFVDIKCDFAIFLDKDKYAAAILSACGIKMFNSEKAVRLCDDKGETCLALSDAGLNIPDTVFAPLCYNRNESSAEITERTADIAIKRLSLPVVVKESYGSMGAGVYLAKTREELIELSDMLLLKPHIYQKYLSAKKGTDVRVIVIGGRAVCAMERHNPDDFRSNLALGGTGKAISLSEEFKLAAEKAAVTLGLDYCGVDLLYGDNGEPFICEVNSNAFFKGIEGVTGKNIARIYAEHIIKSIKICK